MVSIDCLKKYFVMVKFGLLLIFTILYILCMLGFYYNVYAMDWRAKGLWRLGLLKKTKLPQSNGQLLIIEKLVTTLLRIEVIFFFLSFSFLLLGTKIFFYSLQSHTSKVSGTIWLSKPQDCIETDAVQSFLNSMQLVKKGAYDEYVLKNILKGSTVYKIKHSTLSKTE